MAKKKKFYAVATGRNPGIYETWAECEKQTKGFSGARFKSFPTRAEAQTFINENPTTTAAAASAPPPPTSTSEETPVAKRPAKRQRTEAPASRTVTFRGNIAIDIYFDGGSRGNPGAAGAGAHVEVIPTQEPVQKQTIQVRKFLGTRATNNIAEYHGLLCGLEEAKSVATNFESTKKGDTIRLRVRGDSDLVIQQMKGTYQCKSKNLVALHREAQSLVAGMKQLAPMEITFEHVYREDNRIADALANEAMDTGQSWTTRKTDEDGSEDSVKSRSDGAEASEEVEERNDVIYV